MDVDHIMTPLNPVIRWILVSPLHRILSGQLMLITVAGRRTGNRYTIPVGYQMHGNEVTVLVSKAPRKSWWRNFAEPAPVELRLRGRTVQGKAVLIPQNSDTFRREVESILERMPSLGRQFEVEYRKGVALTEEQHEAIAVNAAMVRINLDT